MNRSKEALLDYFMIEELLKNARQEVLYPHIEKDGNSGGGSSGFNKNKEETKCIKIAEDKKIKNLEEIKKGVENALRQVTGSEKEIVEMLYNTADRNKKKFKEVSKITGIPVNYIKNIDISIQILVGQILGY